MKKTILAFILGAITAISGNIAAQSFITIQADYLNIFRTGTIATLVGTNDATIATNTIGQGSGSVPGNAAFGQSALFANTAGANSTAIGVSSLAAQTGAGTANTALGWQSGVTNTTGANNLYFGINSGNGITTGSGNMVLGPATGLAAGLTNNIILANGIGTTQAQHDNTNWTFTSTNNYANGPFVTTGGYNNDAANRAIYGFRTAGNIGAETVSQGTDNATNGNWRIASTRANGTNAITLISGAGATGVISIPGSIIVTGTIAAGGGAVGAAACFKADGITLGYCTSTVAAGGTCTCV